MNSMGKIIVSGNGRGNSAISTAWFLMIIVAVAGMFLMWLIAEPLGLGYIRFSRILGWVRATERTGLWYVFIVCGVANFFYNIIQCILIHSRVSSTVVNAHENGASGKSVSEKFPLSFAMHSSYATLQITDFQLTRDKISSVELLGDNCLIIHDMTGGKYKCYCQSAHKIREAIMNPQGSLSQLSNFPHISSSPLKCTKCGNHLEHTDVFCEDCGQKTSTVAALPAQSPPSAPQILPTPKTILPLQSPVPPSKNTRMPLLFLLDTSATANPYIKQLNDTLNRFKSEVCRDTQSQDILDVAIIQFSDTPVILQSFSSVSDMKAVRLVTGGHTLYAPSIRESMQIVEKYALSLTNPYKPWIILITGSTPSDDIDVIAKEVQNVQGNDKLRFMALGVQGSDPTALKKLTDVVFRLDGTDFTSFFEWICKCISAIAQTSFNEKPQLPTLQGNVYRDK